MSHTSFDICSCVPWTILRKVKKSFQKCLTFDNNDEYDNNNFNELFEENGRGLNTSFYVNFFLYVLKHLFFTQLTKFFFY